MLKSAWAYRNGLKMMREAKEQKKAKKISFVQRGHRKLYAKYGNVKTYANKKQADNAVQKLKVIGYDVKRSQEYPFLIVLIEAS